MILGLTGKAGSGKTTCADYLVNKHGFVKVNFKDALVKEMLENLSDTLEAIKNDENDKLSAFSSDVLTVMDLFKLKPKVMRALMQNYGTDVRRKDSINYWVDKWNKSVAIAINDGKDVVVDDCRFLNEADAIRLAGGCIVYVNCLDKKCDVGAKHISETEMGSIETDETIDCCYGDLDCLHRSLDEIIKNYGGKKN